MDDLEFPLKYVKNLSNDDLRVYFRSYNYRMTLIYYTPDIIKSLIPTFRACFQYLSSRSFDDFTLSEFAKLLYNYWIFDPDKIYQEFSEEIITYIKTKYEMLYAIVYYFSEDDSFLSKTPEAKAFYDNLESEFVKEIIDIQDDIENKSVDSFLIFDILLNRTQLFNLLSRYFGEDNSEGNRLSHLLPTVISNSPQSVAVSLIKSAIVGDLVDYLPKEIFLDADLLKDLPIYPISIMLQLIPESYFLKMFSYYYREAKESQGCTLAFLRKISEINNPVLTRYMNSPSTKKSNSSYTRVSKLLESVEPENLTSELLLKLQHYTFRLTNQQSKQFNDLPCPISFLVSISSNPYKYIDHDKLRGFLLETTDIQLINHCLLHHSGFFTDNEIWARLISFCDTDDDYISNLTEAFYYADKKTYIDRLYDLFFYNYPSNLTNNFFLFARDGIDYFGELPMNQRIKEYFSNCQEILPRNIWTLFTNPIHIIEAIGNSPNDHLPLMLGLFYIMYYFPEPNFKQLSNLQFTMLSIEPQTPESLEEVRELLKKGLVLNLPTTVSHKALSLIVPSLFSGEPTFPVMQVEGLDEDTICLFLAIAFEAFSLSDFGGPIHYHVFSIPSFQNLFFSQVCEQNYKNNQFEIGYILKQCPLVKESEQFILQILRIFQTNPSFYFDVDVETSENLSYFFLNLIDYHGSSSISQSIQKLSNNLSGYIFGLFVKHLSYYRQSSSTLKVLRDFLVLKKDCFDPLQLIKFIEKNYIELDQSFSRTLIPDNKIYEISKKAVEEKRFPDLSSIFTFLFLTKRSSEIILPLLDNDDIPYKTIRPLLTGMKDKMRDFVSINQFMKYIKKIPVTSFSSAIPIIVQFFIDETVLYNMSLMESAELDFCRRTYTSLNSICPVPSSEAFSDFFQKFQIGSREYYAKQCHPKSFKPNSEFQKNFLKILIDEVLEEPTVHILLTLSIVFNLFPFLFLEFNVLDLIIKLFDQFEIFESYQGLLKNLPHLDENDLDDIFYSYQMKDLFCDKETGKDAPFEPEDNSMLLALSSLYLLNHLITNPKFADSFMGWALTNFERFSISQVLAFLSLFSSLLRYNNPSIMFVFSSYLIKYDSLNKILRYIHKMKRPFNNISTYVFFGLVELIRFYLIVPKKSFVGVLKKLIQTDNIFDAVFDKVRMGVFSGNFDIEFNQTKNMSFIFGRHGDHFHEDSEENQYDYANSLLGFTFEDLSSSFMWRFNSFTNNENSTSDHRIPQNPADPPNTLDDPPNDLLDVHNNFMSDQENMSSDSVNSMDDVVSAPFPFFTDSMSDSDILTEEEEWFGNHGPPNYQMRTRLDNSARNRIESIITNFANRREFHPLTNAPNAIISNIRNQLPHPNGPFPFDFLSIRQHLNDPNLHDDDPPNPDDIILPPYQFLLSSSKQYFPFEAPVGSVLFSVLNLPCNIRDALSSMYSLSPRSNCIALFKTNIDNLAHLEPDDRPLDFSYFPSIKHPKQLSHLPDYAISILLQDQIDWPTQFDYHLNLFLFDKPAWVYFIMIYNKMILFPPQYYCELQKYLTEFRQLKLEDEKVTTPKEFCQEYLSNLDVDCLLSTFFSYENSIQSSLSPTITYSTLVPQYFCEDLGDILGTLMVLRPDLNSVIIAKIDQEMSKKNPEHITELIWLLESLSNYLDFKHINNFDQIYHIFKINLLPEFRIRRSHHFSFLQHIISTLVNKTSNASQEQIGTLHNIVYDFFSALIETRNVEFLTLVLIISEKLMETDKRFESLCLNHFDQLTLDLTIDPCDFLVSLPDDLPRYIFSFITVCHDLALKRKSELLLILRYYLEFFCPQEIVCIGAICNFLCPLRTESKSSEELQQSKSREKIIPLCYYNKYPEFWDIVLEYLPKLTKAIDIDSTLLTTSLKFMSLYKELLTFQHKCFLFKDHQSQKLLKTRLNIEVRRSHILFDSFNKLGPMKPKSDLLSTFRVKFANESGIDLDGLTKEWFTLLIKELFNPNYALFTPSEDCRSYQPNPSSNINADHLQYFEFAGQIIARAIIGGVSVDAHLTTSFIKQILGLPLVLKDIEDFDQKLYRSLVWTLENPVNDLDIRFTTGSLDIEEQPTMIELKENGENIVVDDENKKEYVDLICQHIMKMQIEDQINAFTKGFYKLISRDEIALFTPNEFDLLICGIPNIDVNDLRDNCIFQHPYTKNHPVIKMFFKVISSWEHEQLAKLLLFITGSSQVPVGGFRRLKDMGKPLVIAHDNDSLRLPQAHTCFNKLDLPEYKTEEELRKKLLISISECQNFEIA